jgi:hypothetical protein
MMEEVFASALANAGGERFLESKPLANGMAALIGMRR